MGLKREFPILKQPDDITCGPTCLHSVYRYFGDEVPLERVIREITMLKGGGTLGAVLANHALKRGYQVWMYSYNLNIFDPTWAGLDRAGLIAKLKAQARAKKKPKLRFASAAYIKFLENGGEIRFADLNVGLISEYLLQGTPILTGLSATYLYKTVREHGKRNIADDIKGIPQGHFVVLTSYSPTDNAVTVADPYHPESLEYGKTYRISVDHLICAILLGIVTYDGNLIVISKKPTT